MHFCFTHSFITSFFSLLCIAPVFLTVAQRDLASYFSCARNKPVLSAKKRWKFFFSMPRQSTLSPLSTQLFISHKHTERKAQHTETSWNCLLLVWRISISLPHNLDFIVSNACRFLFWIICCRFTTVWMREHGGCMCDDDVFGYQRRITSLCSRQNRCWRSSKCPPLPTHTVFHCIFLFYCHRFTRGYWYGSFDVCARARFVFRLTHFLDANLFFFFAFHFIPFVSCAQMRARAHRCMFALHTFTFVRRAHIHGETKRNTEYNESNAKKWHGAKPRGTQHTAQG